MTLCLGKRPASKDERDLRMKDFVALRPKQEEPEAPVGYGHQGVVTSWQVLGNDRYGCCVWSGAAHETMIWNAVAGHPVSFSDASVLSDYAAVTGFDPRTGAGDEGTDVHDAMSYRRKTGVADASGTRHKIGAFLALDAGDWQQLLQALYLFEAVGVGVEFPRTAMDQFNAGQPWDVEPGAAIDGGHYVPVVQRPGETTLDVVTWGRTQTMTQRFYTTYADEAYAIVSEEMLLSGGRSAEGLDAAALRDALKSL